MICGQLGDRSVSVSVLEWMALCLNVTIEAQMHWHNIVWSHGPEMDFECDIQLEWR